MTIKKDTCVPQHENSELSILDMKSVISVNLGPMRQRIKTKS